MQVTARSTYSLLEWLGDIGGLFKGLRMLGTAMVFPFAIFNRKMTLLTEAFRFVASLRQSERKLD